MINNIVNSIIKFIYSQIFSRVDIFHWHAAINKLSRLVAPVILHPFGKCKITPVNARDVRSEWTTPRGADPDRYIFFIHGGGFTLFSTVFYRDMVCRLAVLAKARVLSLNYRLAPEHPYPAGLEDVVTVYRWLISTGINAARVAVIGDSAGGGLTLSLLQNLRDHQMPLPACAVCMSAWADLTLSGEAYEEQRRKDHLMRGNALRACAAGYLQGKDARDPAVSPVFGDFSNLPPILFQVGGDEVLLNDSQKAFRKSMDAGTKAELSVWPGMVHDFQLWAKVLPDGRKAMREIGAFVKKHIP